MGKNEVNKEKILILDGYAATSWDFVNIQTINFYFIVKQRFSRSKMADQVQK